MEKVKVIREGIHYGVMVNDEIVVPCIYSRNDAITEYEYRELILKEKKVKDIVKIVIKLRNEKRTD